MSTDKSRGAVKLYASSINNDGFNSDPSEARAILTVKKMLRHKSVLNIMKYSHTINFAESDFEETVATTPEEKRKCGKDRLPKYDEMIVNGTAMHFYRKPKRFGGLKRKGLNHVHLTFRMLPLNV